MLRDSPQFSLFVQVIVRLGVLRSVLLRQGLLQARTKCASLYHGCDLRDHGDDHDLYERVHDAHVCDRGVRVYDRVHAYGRDHVHVFIVIMIIMFFCRINNRFNCRYII
ncbi:Uncharacterised protein [Actinobacillus equuli]|nr:Uncharacterised protein [Actinobacillus equuli]